MIDFHTLVVCDEFLEECKASLRWSDHTHFIDNRGKHIREGRISGYHLGDQPYVSFIDDDDYFVGDHEELLRQIDGAPAYFTNSYLLHDTGAISKLVPERITEWKLGDHKSQGIYPHQLVIVRRDVAYEAIDFSTEFLKKHNHHANMFDMPFFFYISMNYGWKYIPEVHYAWRRRRKTLSRQPHQWAEMKTQLNSLIRSH